TQTGMWLEFIDANFGIFATINYALEGT
ncbi:hypothetical protein WJX81_006423, partial [Elliptochloris bilobata]